MLVIKCLRTVMVMARSSRMASLSWAVTNSWHRKSHAGVSLSYGRYTQSESSSYSPNVNVSQDEKSMEVTYIQHIPDVPLRLVEHATMDDDQIP